MIAAPGFGQERVTAAISGCQLCADVRMDARLCCGFMKLRPAINAVSIEQGHGRHSQFGADAREFFGQGSAVEKTERGCRVEFNVGEHRRCA